MRRDVIRDEFWISDPNELPVLCRITMTTFREFLIQTAEETLSLITIPSSSSLGFGIDYHGYIMEIVNDDSLASEMCVHT